MSSAFYLVAVLEVLVGDLTAALVENNRQTDVFTVVALGSS